MLLLVLSRYSAVFVPHEQGLYLSVGLIAAALAAVTIFTPADWRRLWELPKPLSWGISAYGAAALWGVAVGLLSGNPLRYVASQGASMALVVASAVVFLSREALRVRHIVDTLAVGAVISLLIHVAVMTALPRYSFGEGRVVLRFGISGTAPAVMICLVLVSAMVFWGASLLRVAGTVSAVALVVGGMSRGAWVSLTAGAIVLLLIAARGMRPRTALVGVSIGLVLLALAVAGVLALGNAPLPSGPVLARIAGHDSGPVQIEASPRRAERLVVFGDMRPAGSGVEVTGRFQGPPGRRMVIRADFTVRGEQTTRSRFWFIGGTGQWSRTGFVFTPRPDVEAMTLVVTVGAGQGRWLIRELSASEIHGRLTLLLRRLRWRAANLPEALRNTHSDATLLYRIRELRAVREAWGSSSWPRRIAGQGLGAVFPFRSTTWDVQGEQGATTHTSYIHNFYVFLAFKLGVVGLLALGGILAVVTWTLEAGVHSARKSVPGAVRVGVASAWIAFLIWSVSSPEIYDFAMAPLWGLVIGLSERGSDVEADPVSQAGAAGNLSRR